MAITAKFVADFSSFSAAVEKADAQLKDFQSGAGQVEKSVNRLADAFSGRKLIQEATLAAKAVEDMGGVSTLTAKQLQSLGSQAAEAIEKMQKNGIKEIPKNLQDIADAAQKAERETTKLSSTSSVLGDTFKQVFAGFTAASLVSKGVDTLKEFVSSAIEGAGALVDMSDKTGLGIETLQKMSYVAKQSGTDVGAFADAAFKMGVNIEQGTGTARKAADDLGLSWQALRTASPDEQFNMVVQALEAMEDPQRRNTDAVALFGKGAKEILPAIASGYTKIAGEAHAAGDAQVRAIDDAADAWDRFKERTKNDITSAIGDVLLYNEALKKLPKSTIDLLLSQNNIATAAGSDAFKKAVIGAGSAKDVKLAPQGPADPLLGGGASPASSTLIDQLAAAKTAYAALTAEQRKNIEAGLALGKTTDEIINKTGVSDEVIALYKKALEDQKKASEQAASAAKDLAKAVENVNALTAGTSWDGTIDGALKAGASVGDLAKIFHTSEGTIQAHKDALATYAKVLQVEASPALSQFSDTLAKLGTNTTQDTHNFDGLIAAHQLEARAVRGVTNEINNFGTVEKVVMPKALADHLAWLKELDALASGFQQLSQIAGDSLSGIVRMAGTVVSSVSMISKSFDAFAEAKNKTGGADILGEITSGVGIISGVVSIVKTAVDFLNNIGGPSKEELDTRQQRDQFMKPFQSASDTTGIQTIADQLTALGVSAEDAQAEIAMMLDSKNPEQFAHYMEQIKVQTDLFKASMEELPKVTARVTSGMNAISAGTIGAMNSAANGVDVFGDQIDQLTQKQESLRAKIATLNGQPQLTDLQKAQLRAWQDQLAGVDSQIHSLTAQFEKSATAASDFGATGQDAFDRTARLAQTAFHAALASGESFGKAINDIGPTLDDLSTAQEMFGFTSSSTLQTLTGFRKFAQDNQALIGTLDGVNQMMSGLHEMGLLTQADFTDLSDTAVDTFNSMVAGGLDGDTAMRAMQPTLQQIWEMQHDFGMEVDASTQALLDQAEQGGIVGEQFKSIQEQTLDVLRAIAEVLGADIPHALDNIPDHKTIDVDVNYHGGAVPVPDGPSIDDTMQGNQYASTGGIVTPSGVQHFAGGGKVLNFPGGPSGSDTVPAWLTPGEMVLTKDQQRAAFHGGGQVADFSALKAEIVALRAAHDDVRTYLTQDLRRDVARSVRDERQKRRRA